MAGRPESAAGVVAAVQQIFRGGLLSGQSAIARDLESWTAATASDLRARFVDQPDSSSDTFLVKLRRQLDGAPAATIALAAELLFVNMAPLVPEQIGSGRSSRSSTRSCPGPTWMRRRSTSIWRPR
ncbi:hypothetical protein ACFZAV_14515 [Streptomyces sp. NPDC008343]|uniref:hypothetical protein n=1 Tax=Streptomyces sp. NPDC008343 TaxID=3364828 RepID=UPI0036E35BF8